MKRIRLTGKYAIGDYQFAIVDDEDYENLIKYKWWLKKNTYNRKTPYYAIITRIEGNTISIHRFIMGSPNQKVDHKDGNTLNNQRSNLRLATDRQSSQNTSSRKGSSSKYLGVCWDSSVKLWSSRIDIEVGKTITLKKCKDEILCAELHDIAALKYYGEFAKLNFPNKIDYYQKVINDYDFLNVRKPTSNFTGVHWCKSSNKWIAQITQNRKAKHLGRFTKEEDAAEAYKKAKEQLQ